MTKKPSGQLDSLLKEKRIFSPSLPFAQKARIKSLKKYQEIYDQAHKNPEEFWADQAESLHWFKKWDQVLDWKAPDAKWFVNGKLNVSYNCLDRHLKSRGNKTAILWEGEPGETRHISYNELHEETARFAQALLDLGYKKGDRVIIYMPMIPELAIAMLACTRIGLVHSIIFGGFSSTAIRDRVLDCKARLVITADGGWRRGKIVELKNNVDDAVGEIDGVQNVIVCKRTQQKINWNKKKDLWWHELMAKTTQLAEAVHLDSEDPLYVLYTSGTTGKPKGILHTTAGYLIQATATTQWIFDLREDDIYWCSADIGWVTGHTYVIYGLLSNGATTLMYEGAPNHPTQGRFWDIIDKHKVTIFYTSPTAIRAFIQWGDDIPLTYKLTSLRLLGTVGEPINPETWIWFHTVIGKKKCPIVDTWWQTETGSILISPLPGATPTKPGSATLPLPGIEADVVDNEGKSVPPNKGGYLVVKRPWPSMLRTIYGDHPRYVKQYWERFAGYYWTGDEARRDEDGYFWIMGRADDVIKVSGHRLGSSEIESALVSHPMVAESAVVGIPHPLKGEGIVAFSTLVKDAQKNTQRGTMTDSSVEKQLKDHVVKQIGSIARPEEIRIVQQLPKTRSGKIMRRLLRQIASNENVAGDITTLEDKAVIQELSRK